MKTIVDTLIKYGTQLIAVAIMSVVVSGYYWLADRTRAYAGGSVEACEAIP